MEFRPAGDADQSQITRLREAAFGLPHRADEDPPRAERGVHVLADGARVHGVIKVSDWAQWFGGASLGSGAVSSVVVAAQARGQGLGRRLLQATLERMRADGLALSVLYPSTVAPYRAAGYEVGGDRVRYRLGVGDFPARRDAVAAEEWDDGNLDEVRACYAGFAAAGAGMVDRGDGHWAKGVLAQGDQQVQRFVVREDGRVTGYVVLTEETDRGPMPFRYVPGDTPYNYALSCRDLVWLTPTAATSLLSLLAGYRAMATDVLWTGSPQDTTDLFLPTRGGRVVGHHRWLLRLVDVAAALARRGYPGVPDTAVELTVRDAQLADNDGAIRLEVSGGKGTVTRIEHSPVTTDVGTLASLFSGWLHPADAVRAGGLRGARDADVAALAAVFRGPAPWMFEMF